MHEPLSHLDHCTGLDYRLQLKVYQDLLMKYYDFDVSAMRVGCIHPDNGETAFVDEVLGLDQEVNVLMNKPRQFVAEDTKPCQNDMAHMNDRGSSTVAAMQLVPHEHSRAGGNISDAIVGSNRRSRGFGVQLWHVPRGGRGTGAKTAEV